MTTLISRRDDDESTIEITTIVDGMEPVTMSFDDRLPLAQRYHRFITERSMLVDDAERRVLARWLIYFIERPSVMMHERLISYLDQLEWMTLTQLLPEADTSFADLADALDAASEAR